MHQLNTMYYISHRTTRLNMCMHRLFVIWICLDGRKTISAFALNGPANTISGHPASLIDINPVPNTARTLHLTPVYPMLDQTLSFLAYAAFAVYIVMLFSGVVTRQAPLIEAASLLRRQGLAAIDEASINQNYAGTQTNLIPSYLQLMLAQLQDTSGDDKLLPVQNWYHKDTQPGIGEANQPAIGGVGFPTMNRYVQRISKPNGETKSSHYSTGNDGGHTSEIMNPNINIGNASNIFMQNLNNQMYEQFPINPNNNNNEVMRQTTLFPTSWITNNDKLTDYTHHRLGKLEDEASETVTVSSITMQPDISDHTYTSSNISDVLTNTETQRDNVINKSSQYTPISHILRMNDSITKKTYISPSGGGNITEFVNGDIIVTPIHVKGGNIRKYNSKFVENADVNINKKNLEILNKPNI